MREKNRKIWKIWKIWKIINSESERKEEKRQGNEEKEKWVKTTGKMRKKEESGHRLGECLCWREEGEEAMVRAKKVR